MSETVPLHHVAQAKHIELVKYLVNHKHNRWTQLSV